MIPQRSSKYVYAEIVGQFVLAIVHQINPHTETGYAWVIIDRDRDSLTDDVFYPTQEAALIAARSELADEQSRYDGFDAFMDGESMPDNVLDPHWVRGWQAAKDMVGFNLLKVDLED